GDSVLTSAPTCPHCGGVRWSEDVAPPQLVADRVAAVVDLCDDRGDAARLLIFVDASAPDAGAEEIARDVWFLTPSGGRVAATKAHTLGLVATNLEELERLDAEVLVGRECRLELHRPPSNAHPRLVTVGAMAPNYWTKGHGYHPPLEVDQGMPAGEADLLAAAAEAEDAHRDLFDHGDGDGLFGYRGEAIP
ncbi:MAG: hypothetical protein AAFY88_27310, partial [Acidobacteriota bacterium]